MGLVCYGASNQDHQTLFAVADLTPTLAGGQ
jgi:hypothetical protein